MDLSRFRRRHYTEGATPIEAMPRLSEQMAGPNLYVKRDDLLGLAGGGNKARKLEFLVADALARGADTLVTTGAVQSNHCRMTAAAAAREGLKCRLVLEERVPGSYDAHAAGNNLLFSLLGVEKTTVRPAGTDLAEALEQERQALEAEGRVGCVIPGGGSNALGALGYVACAQEIVAQAFEVGLKIDAIVCPSGSGGTHAGLVAGLQAQHSAISVTGISVRAERDPQEKKLTGLANEVLELLSIPFSVPEGAVQVRDDFVGPGYSLPTHGMVEAVRTFGRVEGILLDPVYSGKAAAGLLGLIADGQFGAEDNVLFLHTGGSPALHAYTDTFLGHE